MTVFSSLPGSSASNRYDQKSGRRLSGKCFLWLSGRDWFMAIKYHYYKQLQYRKSARFCKLLVSQNRVIALRHSLSFAITRATAHPASSAVENAASR